VSLTLAQLDAAPADEALAMLAGVYEHSPWFARAALASRPFGSLARLRQALAAAVDGAGRAAQLALLRAHPRLAGKAMVAGTLTAESAGEQARAGLAHCSPEEFARLQALNEAYERRFDWPFILAVRGPDGRGLARSEIIATFERRLHDAPAQEFEECLRNVHRIAAIRLDDLFGVTPPR
jgi:N-carbamoyl-L-amino-acid hydrolase